MPTFDFPPLLWWGLPFVAAPLLIHLINLLRYRRVRFAAIEFLLASQRKYRSRILLRELLLLALRTAAVLGLVLALAQPRWRHALGALLGGPRAAHVLLIDDSYSMSATASADGRTAFDLARQVVERVLDELAASPGGEELAVGRFSALAAGVAEGGGFDIDRQPLTPELARRVREEVERLAPSAAAPGPRAALAAAADVLGTGSGPARVVWLVSDFREKDWKAGGEAAAVLRQLAGMGVELRLVDCAGPEAGEGAANLTVERLEPAGGVPAAGVLVPFEVDIRNDSSTPQRDVVVDLREDGEPRPGVRIEEIPPNGVVTRRFEARFAAAGGHVLEARLPADVLPPDNTRTGVVDVVDRVDVLVIDGDPRGGRGEGDAFYVTAALAPGAGAPTGLRPRVEPTRALATLDLSAFGSVWLLDPGRLDGPEIAALESYARAGGGVVFFAGPRTDAATVNRSLHREGVGLFPVPLAGAVELLPDASSTPVPDLVVEEHPVVAVFAGQRNPLLDAVRVDRFLAVERGHEPPPESGLRRLLSLRTGAPLVVERPFGAGLVVAVLTTAAPTWNNWSRGNPGWVVALLELESHLARGRRRAAAVEIGDPVVVVLERGIDEAEVDFAVPPGGTIVHRTAVVTDAGTLEARLPAANVPGAYVARWRRGDGTERDRTVAVNVDPEEGRLGRIGSAALAAALPGVAFAYDRADLLDPRAGGLGGTPLARPLLALLVCVLVGEQLLALFASYHGRAAAGPS